MAPIAAYPAENIVAGDEGRKCRGRHTAAARLLWAGYSVGDSLEALRMLLVRRGQQPPGPVLVAIDLFVSGHVDLAQWGAATVRHVTASGGDNAQDTPAAVVDRAADSDWLAAVPVMAVASAPAEPFADLPHHLERATDPCETRDNLVHGWPTGGKSVAAHAPPLVIPNRIETRLAWSRR